MIDDITKQLLEPNLRKKRIFRQQLASLNRELDEARIRNIKFGEEVAISKAVLAEAQRIVKSKSTRKSNRWAGFTTEEKNVIKFALKSIQ